MTRLLTYPVRQKGVGITEGLCFRLKANALSGLCRISPDGGRELLPKMKKNNCHRGRPSTTAWSMCNPCVSLLIGDPWRELQRMNRRYHPEWPNSASNEPKGFALQRKSVVWKEWCKIREIDNWASLDSGKIRINSNSNISPSSIHSEG